ncbi:glycosyltransferase [Ruania halotolerans]|uniref:glycosyltransferase n=1 Tax=Ruania halotolerans TaxID=2897773 RepID=UPI001E432C18|nr:glycosyltransferase [Ruania halotolerans]UFU07860.1 glycosyltransferase [Ruania halotolerans]
MAPASTPLPGEPGRGVLGRTTTWIHWALTLTVLCALASAPGLVLLALLDGGRSPWALALGLLPAGPAFSATLFAWRARGRGDAEDGGAPAPWRSFRRGYAGGIADVLRIWVPMLMVLAVLATSAANIDDAGVPGAYVGVLAVIGLGVLLSGAQAIVIATCFSFRTRDAVRLAVHHVFRMPFVTVGVLALVICAVGVLWQAGDGPLVLLGAMFALALWRIDMPLIARIERDFTLPTPNNTPPTTP